MGLISLADLKTLRGVSGTSQDALFNLVIDQCSARIETFCRRIFAAANYTEYYQGNGDKYLTLNQYPINSVASVYEDLSGNWGQGADPFNSETLLTAGTNYAIVKDQGGVAKSGMLYRVDGVWPKVDVYRPGTISPVPYPSPGNIKVTYNAGYATTPYDLQQATAFLIGCVLRTVKQGAPVTSESWQNYSVAFGNAAAAAISGLPPDTLEVLRSYRKTAWG